MGLFRKAIDMYDNVLKQRPHDSCWFRREIVYFYLQYADANVLTFNLNRLIHPRIKEGFATTSEDPDSFMKDYPEYESLAKKYRSLYKGVDKAPELPPKGAELLRLTSRIAKWIQVDSPGFMPHERHYRMFGLAVLQAAQTLRMHVASLKSKGVGLDVPDVYSSHSDEVLRNVVKKDHHYFGWRDFFDIIIRWRQLSAPGDPIWWTDQLTQKQYSERQGMTTYMMNGVAYNVRYGPYIDSALNTTRDLLLSTGYLPSVGSQVKQVTDPVGRDIIKNAKHVSDLYKGVGEGFYVTVPCYRYSSTFSAFF